MKKFLVVSFIIGTLLHVLYFFVIHPVFAIQATSNCIITDVGNPPADYHIPDSCPSVKFTPTGVIPAPNVTKCITVSGGEYCQMPPALNGEYITITHDEGSKPQAWGSREMINLLYTVAQNWKYKHKDGFLIIGDIASDYHGFYRNDGSWTRGNHATGIAADVAATTNGHDCVANHIYDRRCTYGPPYNSEGTIELGRLFMNTGMVRQIIYWDKSTNVISELMNNSTGTHIAELSDHQNHFHIDTRFKALPECQTTNPKAC